MHFDLSNGGLCSMTLQCSISFDSLFTSRQSSYCHRAIGDGCSFDAVLTETSCWRSRRNVLALTRDIVGGDISSFIYGEGIHYERHKMKYHYFVYIIGVNGKELGHKGCVRLVGKKWKKLREGRVSVSYSKLIIGALGCMHWLILIMAKRERKREWVGEGMCLFVSVCVFMYILLTVLPIHAFICVHNSDFHCFALTCVQGQWKIAVLSFLIYMFIKARNLEVAPYVSRGSKVVINWWSSN